MTHEQLIAAGFNLGPNGQYFKIPTLRADDSRPTAKLERNPGHGAVAKMEVQRKIGARFLVRLKTYRKRLLDEDNLCAKYCVDILRYSRVIPSDAPGFTKIEVSQEKVVGKEPERVVIEVFQI